MLLQGFAEVFSNPITLVLILIGDLAGLIFGAIPGLSAFTALAIMLPLTFAMEPVVGISFLMSVYVGGVSGGFISAILLGIPGTPSSIATCFDGHALAKKGQSYRAMGVAVLFSFIGGIFSAVILSTLAPLIGQVALRFSPYEYTAVILLALTTVSALSEGSMVKGLLSCLLGVSLAFVGIDKLSAYVRYTFGFRQLRGGFALVPLLIGLFAVSQVLSNASKRNSLTPEQAKLSVVQQKRMKGFGLTWKEFLHCLKTAGPAAAIGLVVGILPGIGGNVANLLAYSFAKKTSKHPEEFGQGSIEGICAPETANNAAVGGALIILLTLGIPGDNATSMIMAGFQIHGIAPGPLLFSSGNVLVYAVFAAFIMANVFMLLEAYFGLTAFSKILSIRTEVLLPVVIAFCFVGSYSSNNRIFDIAVMVAFGLLGYILKKNKYPLAPLVVGFILTPMLEENLRRSLMRSKGSLMPMLTSPIAVVFLLLTAVVLVYTVVNEVKKSRKGQTEDEVED
ncbi:MAG: tripartite tricarboxylate transporter permease [Clostridia bacterium]|nr:tripartite tricarboxylate transporter permease [Clostridia bacterium]